MGQDNCLLVEQHRKVLIRQIVELSCASINERTLQEVNGNGSCELGIRQAA